jgi:SHS2 domain-containing protein
MASLKNYARHSAKYTKNEFGFPNSLQPITLHPAGCDCTTFMNTAQPSRVEPFDHTADVGFMVTTATLEELFASAAQGMFNLITDPASVRPVHTRHITVTADDHTALMVRWLSELNFLHQTEHILFCEFKLHISPGRLDADVAGEPVDLSRHAILAEIKAVTFHGLKVEQTADQWQARILFDV